MKWQDLDTSAFSSTSKSLAMTVLCKLMFYATAARQSQQLCVHYFWSEQTCLPASLQSILHFIKGKKAKLECCIFPLSLTDASGKEPF